MLTLSCPADDYLMKICTKEYLKSSLASIRIRHLSPVKALEII